MKLLILTLALGLGLASFSSVEAAPVKKQAKKAHVKAGKKIVLPHKATSGELQTDVKFDDSVLHGQYQTPDEALARVENEKGLSDLLGVRKHFKDRLQTASEQE